MGNPDAQFRLAQIHATGRAGSVNPKLAAKYYLDAAASGHETARKLVIGAFLAPVRGDQVAGVDKPETKPDQLILMEVNNRTPKTEIFEYATALAEDGDLKGKLVLADCYQRGIGTEPNPLKAEEILRGITGNALSAEPSAGEKLSTPSAEAEPSKTAG
jgi:TPR repeat protein